MNENSRTRNVSVNAGVGLACQVINLILSFVTRTVFIYTLGKEYLGVNGLFTNILSILSFAELGIGNAIVFSMYKPLAQHNTEKLASLMKLYQKAYHIIGAFIAIAGLCVVPFLGYIIHEKPDIPENISVLYILFLLQTVLSYFFAYKKSIITADQKNYIVLSISTGIHIVQTISQIILLYLTQNYILYLSVQLGFVLLENVAASLVADRLYPYLKEKAEPLPKEESQRIFKNVRSLAVYKFGSVILNGTDNILVSALVGVAPVGMVSNYVLLNTSCNTILHKILEAFTASVGNLNADSTREKKYDVFNKLFFITAWLYGFAAIGLLTVTQSFIPVWVGKEYLLDDLTAFAIVLEFYVKGVSFAAYTYRTTLGYFVQGKIAPLCAAVLNILLSVTLFYWVGLPGIFLATPIARLLTTGIIDPVLIFRKAFNRNPVIYYTKYFSYIILFFALYLVCSRCLSFVSVNGWLGIIMEILIVSIVFNGCMLLVFCRTRTFRDLWQSMLNILSRKNTQK